MSSVNLNNAIENRPINFQPQPSTSGSRMLFRAMNNSYASSSSQESNGSLIRPSSSQISNSTVPTNQHCSISDFESDDELFNSIECNDFMKTVENSTVTSNETKPESSLTASETTLTVQKEESANNLKVD